jgi:hypothetical protein
MLLYYTATMSERLPFSLAHWGLVPRLILALALVGLVWAGVWSVL